MDARYTQVKQKKKLDPGDWLYVHSTFNKQLHRCPEFETRVRAWAEVVTTKQTNKKQGPSSEAVPGANACDCEPMAGKASTGFRVFRWFLFLFVLFVFCGRISGSLCCAMTYNVAEDGFKSGPFCLHLQVSE